MAPSDFSCTCGILVYEDDNDDTGRLTPLKEDFLSQFSSGAEDITPCRATWGNTRVDQVAERSERGGLAQRFYCFSWGRQGWAGEIA